MYSEIFKKFWLDYLIIFIIAMLLINWDSKIFLAAATTAIFYKIDLNSSYTTKLNTVLNLINEGRIFAIIKKLKITKEELNATAENIKNNLSDEEWKIVEKNIRDIYQLRQ